jgi:hypothetical protein
MALGGSYLRRPCTFGPPSAQMLFCFSSSEYSPVLQHSTAVYRLTDMLSGSIASEVRPSTPLAMLEIALHVW